MYDEYQTSDFSADSLFGRAATERSGSPENRRHRQQTDAVTGDLWQGSEGTARTTVTATAERASGILEEVSSVDISVSRSDRQRAAGTHHHSKSDQNLDCKSGHRTQHHTTHDASQFCDSSSGSGGGFTDDQSLAGPQEFFNDDEVSACTTPASEQRAQSRGLVTGETTAGMDAAGTQHAAGHAAGSPGQQRREPAFRVHDILKDNAAAFVAAHPSAAVRQVQSTLSKISLCRTGALGGSWHWCAECETGIRIPNSCGDRHCPLCRGATRAAWVDSATKKIVAGVDYYQVVFTLPDRLSSLALGNRRKIFNLLFHAAWKSLKKVLEDEQAYEAAATMVLHTWNQHVDSHVHLHAVVPGGGPSLNKPGTWKNAVPPPHERPDRWWLVDADDLRHEFRKQFLKGLRLLHKKKELKLSGDWSHLQDTAAFEEFLAPLEQQSWVTYIQPPPTESSQPEDIVKYLARYLTGGPISDTRLLSHQDGRITFSARTGRTHGGSDETEDVELPAVEFVRRWCLHILPKGFTKTRGFGGWSNHHSRRYVAECRTLHGQPDLSGSEACSPPETNDTAADGPVGSPCPMCGGELERLERVHRTSWRDIFSGNDCPSWYTFGDRPG